MYHNNVVAYLYETHLHTAGVSKCAVSGGADYISGYIDKGYSGLIVTDHFFNANCALSRKLPWSEWVKQFYRGFEEAKNEGDRRGFDVFFGWEETFEGCDDYLVYGLDKDWLLEHPEVRTWTRGEQYRSVKEAGGCVVQAHPFRQRYYIKKVVLSAGCVDAVEVANGGNDIEADVLAYHYAKKINKPMLAGSDIHDAMGTLNDEVLGIYLHEKPKNIADFVSAICNNEIASLKTGQRRFDFPVCDNMDLPVEIRDEEDMVTDKHWKDYI